MAKSANKDRSEVALPDKFGKGVFISFTVDAMERLQSDYGVGWIEKIIEETDVGMISVFKSVLSNTVVGDVALDFSVLQGVISETRVKILDALFLSIHGRTVEEQMAKEEADKIAGIGKQLERMGQDPQMASALNLLGSLQQLGGQGTAPASDPMRSDASPQEK
jgi:hypothetical protein